VRRKVEVVGPDAKWATAFEEAARELREVLGDEVVAVHHIGSTAIRGIPAKPIVDLLIEVWDVDALDAYDAEMERRGYRPHGEHGIPGRRFYVKGSDAARTHHVHAFQRANPHVARHLAFRDYLNAHPREAQAYGALKRRLARAHPYDIEAYVAGKDAFIKEVDRRAAAWRPSTLAGEKETVLHEES
jgi:GrpB-like predicted nucleotidyltransferase (UPF0157 family)